MGHQELSSFSVGASGTLCAHIMADLGRHFKNASDEMVLKNVIFDPQPTQARPQKKRRMCEAAQAAQATQGTSPEKSNMCTGCEGSDFLCDTCGTVLPHGMQADWTTTVCNKCKRPVDIYYVGECECSHSEGLSSNEESDDESNEESDDENV